MAERRASSTSKTLGAAQKPAPKTTDNGTDHAPDRAADQAADKAPAQSAAKTNKTTKTASRVDSASFARATAGTGVERKKAAAPQVTPDEVEEREDIVDAVFEDGPSAATGAHVLEPDIDDDAAIPPLIDDEDDGDGPILDVGEPGLVRRSGVALPQGEWVVEAPDEPVTDDDLKRGARLYSRGDSAYEGFVRQATSVARLSEEEERSLGLRVRDHGDQAAAKKLVVHNLRLAIKMAHQYRRAWTNLMDLIQEASTGMAIASQRWDPDQGTRYGTYAVYWIRAQLTKFLMTNGRAIHTGNTRAGRKLYFQLPRVRRKLLAEGKEPSIANIAAEVQETPEEVARIVARLDGREASLDAQLGNDDDSGTLGDIIAGDDAGPEANAARLEVNHVIDGLMTRFADKLEDERDRAIWFEHLVATEPKSLVELGARYGVSKQRMGQLATRIKRSFRRHVIDELGPTTQLRWLFSQD